VGGHSECFSKGPLLKTVKVRLTRLLVRNLLSKCGRLCTNPVSVLQNLRKGNASILTRESLFCYTKYNRRTLAACAVPDRKA
jgi:hypothetical protein